MPDIQAKYVLFNCPKQTILLFLILYYFTKFVTHELINLSLNTALTCRMRVSLVVEQYVGALDVAMQEVALMAVVESVKQLLHERRDARLVEVHQSRLQQTHQVVVHVLEHQVERTCVTAKTIYMG